MKSIMGSTTLGEQTAAFTEITSFAGEEKGAAKQMASVMEMFMEHMYMEFLKKKK